MFRTLRTMAAALMLTLAFVPGCGDDGTSEELDATASTGRFETFEGEDGRYYFHLLAKNGECVLASQGYSTLAGAKKGIESVRKNGVDTARFAVNETDGGEFYFNLVAGNGQVIGTSETYVSSANAKKGVTAVQRALATPTTGAADDSGARFETFTGADSKSYFRLRADNGEIILQSQGYSSKSAAQGGIDTVKKNGIDASKFQVFEGADGQHTFRLVAGNGQIIARTEMFVSKSNAFRAADRVREILRDLAGKSEPSDTEIKGEVERVSTGLWYTSESDYPFTFVSATAPGTAVGEDEVRAAFASIVNADEDADKPMADLVGMESTWQEWKDGKHNCWDTEDPVGAEQCTKMRNLEQVIEANLTDVRVFYFGADGQPGNVEGTGVSVFIVGRSASGKLVGVRTLAIWT